MGNINATWTFHGVAGHSARPWLADNAIHRAAAGIAALAAREPIDHDFAGLTFREVVSAVTIHGGVAATWCPTRVAATQLALRPGHAAAAAEAGCAPCASAYGELVVDVNAPSGAVAEGNPLVDRLVAAGDLTCAQAGVDAGRRVRRRRRRRHELRPGRPAYAHRRDERVVEDASLVRSHETLVSASCAP